VCSSVSGRFFLRAYRTHSPFTAPVSDQARAAIARAKAKHLFWNNMRYALSASVMKPLTPTSSLILAGLWGAVFPITAQVNVTQEHNHLSRDGLYIDSAFTRSAAANVRRDLNFNGTISGNVYAQPLYIEGGPSGRARVVTRSTPEETGAAVKQLFVCKLDRSLVAFPPITGHLLIGSRSITVTSI
jgi:hypothetical protein